MTKDPGFLKKTVDVDNRHFVVKLLNFENGCFVAISEGSEKLGSMVVSLGTGPTPITSTIIPSRSGSLFLKLTAEKISTDSKGIAVVSFYVEKELTPNILKTLLREIMDLVRNV